MEWGGGCGIRREQQSISGKLLSVRAMRAPEFVCMGGLSLVGEFLDNPLGPEAEVLGGPECGSH